MDFPWNKINRHERVLYRLLSPKKEGNSNFLQLFFNKDLRPRKLYVEKSEKQKQKSCPGSTHLGLKAWDAL